MHLLLTVNSFFLSPSLPTTFHFSKQNYKLYNQLLYMNFLAEMLNIMENVMENKS